MIILGVGDRRLVDPRVHSDADVRADVWAEGEGREQEGQTHGVLLEHGDDLFQACRLLADLADDVLLEEIRQRGAAAQGRFPRWHHWRRRSGPTACGWLRDVLLHPLNLDGRTANRWRVDGGSKMGTRVDILVLLGISTTSTST